MNKEIPKDLDTALQILIDVLPKKDITYIKDHIDQSVLHHTMGRGIRNNWELWNNSALVHWFNSKGITHPDDMSAIILDSLHMKLNDQDIQLDTQINYYRDYWQKNQKNS